MSHTISTLSDGDLVRRALAIFHNNLTFIKTINRQYDARFAVEGAKNGGSLLIRDPNQFNVTDGAVMSTEDIAETTQTLTVATQKHVAMPNFSSLDKTMSVQDFDENYLMPAMAKLAAIVENTVLSNVYKDIFNFTGTAATTPATLLAIRNAGARLSKELAPTTMRNILMDSDAMVNTVNSLNTYFHKATELERSFSENFIGHAAGFDWFESEMTPNHTNGTRTGGSPVVNTSTGITSGTAVITMTAFPDGLTYKKGDVFTVADVYAVNLETKDRYSYLQPFVVTADETETGSGDMSPAVSPTPITSGAKQNVELVSAGASKAVENTGAGSSGAADLVANQNIAYHKNAFTFVSADLHIEPGKDMVRKRLEGISMRYWRGEDIVNDKFPARLDVLFGYKTLRPEWAVRVRG